MWPEALPAFGIIATMVVVTGSGLLFLDKWQNNGKPRRYGLDDWDERMILRDKRITGSKTKQQSL